MNTFLQTTKTLCNETIYFLNQPLVKDGVKNIASSITFAFGLVEIYDIYQIIRGREISSEINPNLPKWMQIAHKVVIVSAKISLILSGGVSRPGVFIISNLLGLVFTTAQLNSVFGPNTIFAINPWHPRHIVSIAAVILALPSIALTAYDGFHWIYEKCKNNNQHYHSSDKNWITDSKIQLMDLFNTLTSRPLLHLGNQLLKV